MIPQQNPTQESGSEGAMEVPTFCLLSAKLSPEMGSKDLSSIKSLFSKQLPYKLFPHLSPASSTQNLRGVVYGSTSNLKCISAFPNEITVVLETGA